MQTTLGLRLLTLVVAITKAFNHLFLFSISNDTYKIRSKSYAGTEKIILYDDP